MISLLCFSVEKQAEQTAREVQKRREKEERPKKRGEKKPSARSFCVAERAFACLHPRGMLAGAGRRPGAQQACVEAVSVKDTSE